jgi:hypothetical protein
MGTCVPTSGVAGVLTAILLDFGRDHCGVARQEEVVERIRDALSDTLKVNRGRTPEELWRGLEGEWGMPATK